MTKTSGPPKACYTSRQTDESVFEFRIPAIPNSEFELNTIVISDPHWDSIHCGDRRELKNICDQAVAKQALIIITGDLFDAMQGISDPRHRKSEVRPEYLCDNWPDRMVEDCARWFAPYSENLIMVSDGNHETKFRKRLETNLIQRFLGIVNTYPDTKAYYGHYAGSIKFLFQRHDGKQIDSHILNYHHGTGYGSDVKRRERAGEYPDASILTFGHHHNCESKKLARTRISAKGRVHKDEQILIVCPSLKDEIGTGAKGWAVEEGHRTKPMGAHWVRFFYSRVRDAIAIDYYPAQVI